MQDNIFDRINGWIRGSEASLVNLLSALAPWLAPLAPAYMSYHHMVGDLGFPVPVALAVAGVVEVLGLASISTILSFWSHNKRYKQEYKRAPVLLAMFSFIGYLAVVLTVNVFLDASKIAGSGLDPEWVAVLGRGLLVLLSIPAAVLLAVRAQHTDMLSDIADERNRVRQERAERRLQPIVVPATVSKNPGNNQYISYKKKQFVADYRSGKLQKIVDEKGEKITPQLLMEIYQVSQKTAYRWLEAIRETDYGK